MSDLAIWHQLTAIMLAQFPFANHWKAIAAQSTYSAILYPAKVRGPQTVTTTTAAIAMITPLTRGS